MSIMHKYTHYSWSGSLMLSRSIKWRDGTTPKCTAFPHDLNFSINFDYNSNILSRLAGV